MSMIKELDRKEIQQILIGFGIKSFEQLEMIDSSHGENDIRHNYIIDNKYVLRVNSAKVRRHIFYLINQVLTWWYIGDIIVIYLNI